MGQHHVIRDGNEQAADVAYRLSETIAIYPITPASPMGEHADAWSAAERPNLFGDVPTVVEMQSEGGAAGAVHGALQAGTLSTTFTASQGLLLMLPNMFKIAGELTPAVIHVAARTVATHALSIFGDHSDVMAARTTGFALLASSNVQAAGDLAAVAHAATLESRVPFLHFFDGFRTSHEVAKVQPLSDADLAALVPEEAVWAHRLRALNPEHPVLRGSAQNPDVFFQAREAANPFYDRVPQAVEAAMARLGELTGRRYRLFEYEGHPEAERVVVIMGSAAETAAATALELARRGERVGVVNVRLYRPFSAAHLLAVLPPTVRALAVLDRTKEPGAPGDPLYLDVVAALAAREKRPRIIGGRYGLSGKELTPGMIAAVFDTLVDRGPRRHFTLGIRDDVTGTSLPWDEGLRILPESTWQGLFYGLGSDGTVGANKSTIKIIGEATEHDTQGYFVYDSKKSGAMTVSHLRFGPGPLRAPYLVSEADFLAVHHPAFLERHDLLTKLRPGGTLLLNASGDADSIFAALPAVHQGRIRDKSLAVFALDAGRLAREAGLGNRISTTMQAAFFAVSGVLDKDRALDALRASVEQTYAKKGKELVEKNLRALEGAREAVTRVTVPEGTPAGPPLVPPVPPDAPDFVQRVTARIIAGEGDLLPVSAFPPDGTFPTGTAKFERRNLADAIPEWVPELCIQCNKCALVCPHAAIRVRAYPEDALAAAPEGFLSLAFKGRGPPAGTRYTVQTAPEDCTGCGVCVEVCPAHDRLEPQRRAVNMVPKGPVFDVERARYEFFLDLPDAEGLPPAESVKGSQLREPLFEYSGACAGCGETPYLKLLTQLLGDRMLIANATGCSSIFGGNLPTTPWTVDRFGRGPAWSNSLFEDNAEFGYGMRVAVTQQQRQAESLVAALRPEIGEALADRLLAPCPEREDTIADRREAVAELMARIEGLDDVRARRLEALADALVPRSVWIVGGDGWAYDIGYGGLDHVLASGADVNVLVLDTEVYSNTGGQMSKATPKGAVARFAARGKRTSKKDLALMAMSYGNVYVARVAMGANDGQTVRALTEAAAYPGPSLVIAYAHCIAHGIHMGKGMEQQALAVQGGHWPLLRFDPRRADAGKPPLVLDSKAPAPEAFERYAAGEGRYRALEDADPAEARRLRDEASAEDASRFHLYEALARRLTDD